MTEENQGGGQLGTINQIRGEIQIAITNAQVQLGNISQQLEALANHFSANRLFERDPLTNQLRDAPGSLNVKRYVYTEQVGWIDMHHFTEFALITRERGLKVASLYAYASEEAQGFIGREASAYSYEDIPSDFAGIDFWLKNGTAIDNGEIELVDAIIQYLIDLGATNPENAPNYEYIPHTVNASYMLKNMGDGLTGDKLKEAHMAVYEKRSEDDKARIKDAHETIQD